jgi:hypothetical protein
MALHLEQRWLRDKPSLRMGRTTCGACTRAPGEVEGKGAYSQSPVKR